jgi:hypothetical protein
LLILHIIIFVYNTFIYMIVYLMSIWLTVSWSVCGCVLILLEPNLVYDFM